LQFDCEVGRIARQTQVYFALRQSFFRPIERVMGQQHRVRVKRRRRVAYLDRKKAAAKAAPVRREAPKTKAKPKKQVAPAPET
jgi:hydroxyacyl-ACP dehydratase HTD2-like protein with hotdog domain